MQTRNRVLDDIARLASGALGLAAGIGAELNAVLRERLGRLGSWTEQVGREEFEAVKAMAAKARAEQEALIRRLAELEGKAPRRQARGAERRRRRRPSRRGS